MVETDSHSDLPVGVDVQPMIRRATAAALLPVLAIAAAACGGDDDAGSGSGRLSVVANFYPIAEAARQVGGDRVDVSNLTPAGVEPHDLELNPDQVDHILDADVVLYLGKGFQPAVADVADQQGDRAVDLTKGVHLEAGASDALKAEEGGGGNHSSAVDPHFWLDPTRMADAVDEIEAALAKADPDDAATFAANAQRYQDELATLDHDMQAGLANCRRDEIVTSHAAFFYLAERYGLRQLPISGLSPDAEPDPDRLSDLTDRIERDHITTVFYETLVSPDVARTLAREAHVDTAVLDPIEGLTKKDADAGKDYLAVMRDNLAALRDALGCT
jgi:zinc transport system substrate-binding protein